MPTPHQLEPFATLETTQALGWALRDVKLGFARPVKVVAGGGGGEGGPAAALSKRVAKALLEAKTKSSSLKKEGSGGGGGGSLPSSQIAAAAAEVPEGDGQTRLSTVWLFNNGASDSVEERELSVYEGNPGATWCLRPSDVGKGGPRVVLVPIDDLLGPSSRDPLTVAPALGPVIEPLRVRLIKISAEQMDSRVISGMRRLLSVGRIPFVIFVFNDAHVKEQGCDASEMLGALVDQGYRLYHAGIFYARMEDVKRFLKGQSGGNPRSTELVFVGPGAEWA